MFWILSKIVALLSVNLFISITHLTRLLLKVAYLNLWMNIVYYND